MRSPVEPLKSNINEYKSCQTGNQTLSNSLSSTTTYRLAVYQKPDFNTIHRNQKRV